MHTVCTQCAQSVHTVLGHVLCIQPSIDSTSIDDLSISVVRIYRYRALIDRNRTTIDRYRTSIDIGRLSIDRSIFHVDPSLAVANSGPMSPYALMSVRSVSNPAKNWVSATPLSRHPTAPQPVSAPALVRNERSAGTDRLYAPRRTPGIDPRYRSRHRDTQDQGRYVRCIHECRMRRRTHTT